MKQIHVKHEHCNSLFRMSSDLVKKSCEGKENRTKKKEASPFHGSIHVPEKQ